MSDQGLEAYQPPKLPSVRTIHFSDVRAALLAGWQDFKKAPLLGLFFGGFYAVGGLAIWAGLMVYNMPWMIIPLAIGFPLVGPFVAVGTYEVSRRLLAGEPLVWRQIFFLILGQRERQLGWMAFVVLFIFWIWVYQIRLVMALFLGFKTYSSLGEFLSIVTTTPEGLGFLAVGTIIGALISFSLFAATVVAMPLLMARDIDFVSAIIVSFNAVRINFLPMLGFALVVGGLTLVAMLPAFMGLLVVLPVLGHATWHLYTKVVVHA
ncbi:DUF2189 domain-containing protein [uncultured Maritalea sp.]|jgi:uncharacterized membrane protein|uniref:DUF2189 domain-containing protein n=1 Tax=uncultured Maritalea sp. TaxID=757249 RepID=UPI0026155059|nr:DUF2189 domain-containing protein [uncultured Maritalea sp.]